MPDPRGPVLSVRGVAYRTVTPDSAAIYAAVETIAGSKAAALAQAGEAVDLITADLRDLGGRAQDAESARHPLTWSSRIVTTNPEQQHNFDKQRTELTGRIQAHVALHLTVRDFALLDPVGDRLARHEMFNIHGVNWSVDDDNPAWPLVRAEAIHAAIRQGRITRQRSDARSPKSNTLLTPGCSGATAVRGAAGGSPWPLPRACPATLAADLRWIRSPKSCPRRSRRDSGRLPSVWAICRRRNDRRTSRRLSLPRLRTQNVQVPSSPSDLLLSRRDLDFLLYEWLDVESLTKRDRFAEHSRDTFDAALDLAAQVATEQFAPHNRRNDLEEPRFEDGRGVLHPRGRRRR